MPDPNPIPVTRYGLPKPVLTLDDGRFDPVGVIFLGVATVKFKQRVPPQHARLVVCRSLDLIRDVFTQPPANLSGVRFGGVHPRSRSLRGFRGCRHRPEVRNRATAKAAEFHAKHKTN
jgi:hypothetical protein